MCTRGGGELALRCSLLMDRQHLCLHLYVHLVHQIGWLTKVATCCLQATHCRNNLSRVAAFYKQSGRLCTMHAHSSEHKKR